MKDLGVLVLAAGLSTRMNGPNKLLLPWRGEPLVRHVLALADGVAATHKTVVTHRDVAQIQALLACPDQWQCLVNEDTASGLASSLRLGLAHLTTCSAVLILLADMPDVRPSTLQRLINDAQGDDYAVVPTFGGQWGNPVLLLAQAIQDCRHLKGDQGARKLLLANRKRVREVVVDDPAILHDFDVASDFVAN